LGFLEFFGFSKRKRWPASPCKRRAGLQKLAMNEYRASSRIEKQPIDRLFSIGTRILVGGVPQLGIRRVQHAGDIERAVMRYQFGLYQIAFLVL
jgi:hypothetical protein